LIELCKFIADRAFEFGDWLQRNSGAVSLLFAAVVAAFTVKLTLVTRDLWQATRDAAQAAKDTASHTRTSERAYVKMSHTPPGVSFSSPDKFILQVQIKNSGQTPAQVTDAILKRMILSPDEELPGTPDYTSDDLETTQAFLVAHDKIFAIRNLPITDKEWARVRAGAAKLYVYGYVDYVDVFGGRHRGGYAREYISALDIGKPKERNNLNVVTNSAYNYDRQRNRGEGKDWE
jgi:hypothetical protein